MKMAALIKTQITIQHQALFTLRCKISGLSMILPAQKFGVQKY
jgi:hypothetical protein